MMFTNSQQIGKKQNQTKNKDDIRNYINYILSRGKAFLDKTNIKK